MSNEATYWNPICCCSNGIYVANFDYQKSGIKVMFCKLNPWRNLIYQKQNVVSQKRTDCESLTSEDAPLGQISMGITYQMTVFFIRKKLYWIADMLGRSTHAMLFIAFTPLIPGAKFN